MDIIQRYSDIEIVTTPLDPLADVTSWVSGLRSRGYVGDVLQAVHGIDDDQEIENSAKMVSTYAENAVGLIQQAYAGPPEISFLPLYYAIVNLSKIYVITARKSLQLKKERVHGATYPNQPHDSLLNEKIHLGNQGKDETKDEGTFALLYKAITKEDKSPIGQITLGKEVYPYIGVIGYEYESATRNSKNSAVKPYALRKILLNLLGDSSSGFFLRCEMLSRGAKSDDLTLLKALKDFELSEPFIAVSPKVFGQKDTAIQHLEKFINRYLLYLPEYRPWDEHNITYRTPLSEKPFPEEMPLWLAFFHLSNVVRYYPERLASFRDSKYWTMLLALHKHGLFRFIVLFWSYFHQKSFIITTGSI